MKKTIITLVTLTAAGLSGVALAADSATDGKPQGGPGGGFGPEARQRMLERFDKDGDGQLSDAERETMRAEIGQRGGPGGPGGPGGERGKFFETADKNGDGKLTQDEAPPELWARISKADADGDQAVTREELGAAMRGRGGPGGPGGSRPDFESLDKNSDGKITQDEAPAEAWDRMAQADTNEDGAVTKEELGAMMSQRGGPAGPGGPKGPGGRGNLFEKNDKNGDGKISQDEAPAEAWARLSQADKDGDNAVTREELGAMMRERGGPGGPGGPDGGKGRRGPGGPGSPGVDTAQMFQSLDKNADEKLTEDEVPPNVWKKMSEADTDGDGAVTKAELEASNAKGPGGPGRKKPEEKTSEAQV